MRKLPPRLKEIRMLVMEVIQNQKAIDYRRLLGWYCPYEKEQPLSTKQCAGPQSSRFLQDSRSTPALSESLLRGAIPHQSVGRRTMPMLCKR